MVGTKFLLHTETYSMEENEVGLNIRVQYTLDDGGGHTPIVGEQEITAVYYDEKITASFRYYELTCTPWGCILTYGNSMSAG